MDGEQSEKTLSSHSYEFPVAEVNTELVKKIGIMKKLDTKSGYAELYCPTFSVVPALTICKYMFMHLFKVMISNSHLKEEFFPLYNLQVDNKVN